MSAWEGSAWQEAQEKAKECQVQTDRRTVEASMKIETPPERETSPDLELSTPEYLAILVNHARVQLEATRLNGALLVEILETLKSIRSDLAHPLQRFVDSRA